MANGKRYLMAFETKDDSKIIVDFENTKQMQKYQLEAASKGIRCKKIKIEEYNRTDFYGCRYFDLHNHHTRQSFELKDWMAFLEHWIDHESGKKNFYDH